MAFIRVIDEGDADGELAQLYRDAGAGGAVAGSGPIEAVDNILKIHSLDPKSLRAHLAVYRSAMTGTRGLPKVERELIALVVSSVNGCRY